MSLTAKQIEERCNYIGGSEAGAILRLNPYDSPYNVWERKVDGKQNNISNAQIYWGNLLEPIIRDEFDYLCGQYTFPVLRIYNDSIKYHKKYDFLAGHVDGVFFNMDECVNTFSNKAILEIKTVSPRMRKYWGEENHDLDCLKHRVDADKQVPGLMGDKGEIPNYHYAQCAFYMMLYNLDVTYLAAFFGNEFPWKVYKIERDLEFEKWMLEELINFWGNNVLKGIPPAPQTLGDIIKIYPNGIAKEKIIATNEICEKSHEFKSLKIQIKDAKVREEELKGELKIFMKDAEILVDISGNKLNTWSRKKQSKFQQKLFKESEPDIYNKYKKEVDYERFC